MEDVSVMNRIVSASILALGAVLGAHFLVDANSAVIPPVVILDMNGEPVGPVVGFVKSQKPFVRIVDPVNDVPVFPEVLNESHMRVTDERTFFSLAGCTGTAYHEVPFAEEGLEALSGFMYSIADMGAGQLLFASPTSDAGSMIGIQSQYLNDMCSNTMDTKTLRAATVVLDLDATHPPPYSLP